MDTIRESTLRELAAAGSVDRVRLQGQRGGFSIVLTCGAVERVLATVRGEVRLFSLSSAALFIRDLGVSRFEVDVTNYELGRLRKPRPDRAAALRATRTNPIQSHLALK